MPETAVSFYKIKKFLIIRNLFFLLFKISMVAFSFLFLFLVFFITILSIKPRKINIINDYLLEKLNNIKQIDFSYDTKNSLLQINKELELEYDIDNFSAKNDNISFSIPKIIVKIDFSDLLIGKINIKNVSFVDGNLKIFLNNKTNIDKNEENIRYKDVLQNIQNKLALTNDYSFIAKKLDFDNFKIDLIKNNKQLLTSLINSKSNIDIRGKNFNIDQNIKVVLNNSEKSSELDLLCNINIKNDKKCTIKLYDIDVQELKNIFKERAKLYSYLQNIYSIFNLETNIYMDNDFNIKSGNLNLFSSGGNFYLKDFFDEKIDFKNLAINTTFNNNFKEFNIESLKTKFDNTDFFLSMFIKNLTNYSNIDLNLEANNVILKELKKLWPNFLGQEDGIRPWVLTHILSGKSPKAIANMNFKYFHNNNHKKESGLQKIYSKIELSNVLLNYDNYFPIVKNINGNAIFTKNNMKIQINSAKILDSSITKGNISMNFHDQIPILNIKTDIKGPSSDLFIHIDKNDAKLIKTSANNVISDFYTKSHLELSIPLVHNLDFHKVSIDVNSNIFNKIDSIFKNNSNILVSFNKPKNSNSFSGKINFSNSYIEFLPLNIVKEAGRTLIFDYGAEILDNNIVKLTKFNPLVDYLKFTADGYIDFNKKEQEITLQNIKYNNSNYNLYFTSYTANNKLFNNIIINGDNVNYSDIINKIKNIKLEKMNNNGNNLISNELSIKADLNYINFNDNKLYKPTFLAIFKNNKLNNLDFYTKIDRKKFVNISFDKKKDIFKIKSNDFGKLFSAIELSNSIKNGDGSIELSTGKNNTISGKINIEKSFTILPDDNVKKSVIEDVDDDKNFKDLEKKLKKNKGITFDKLVGRFSYLNDILTLKEVVASSKYIGFQILASGFINVNNNDMNIKGLFMPVGLVNGLFGINKVPVISNIIFGQKNGGLFASKFEATKNGNEKINIKINKFSMILPGFLRNIFTD